jgi:hypothetical protein
MVILLDGSWWAPTFAGARAQVDGLGSYSSYEGNITAPQWAQMGYKTSWDLSGRFFPYMGQFLPKMGSSTSAWHNDKEGTQKPANVSSVTTRHHPSPPVTTPSRHHRHPSPVTSTP